MLLSANIAVEQGVIVIAFFFYIYTLLKYNTRSIEVE